MVQGRDRRVELGYQLALNCRAKIIYPPKNKNSKHNKTAAQQQIATQEDDTSSVKSNHNTVKASA